ncbi:hypothetical protein T484DRAFT_1774749 [Baffinella frigidus]|nr:hypothetical protein T484DRAFT_1774749 [Cryptophyta sp. CCMP2293]
MFPDDGGWGPEENLLLAADAGRGAPDTPAHHALLSDLSTPRFTPPSRPGRKGPDAAVALEHAVTDEREGPDAAVALEHAVTDEMLDATDSIESDRSSVLGASG